MKLAIMQPYFFPYIGYYQLIESVDKFILYDNLNFINHGWINRNRILMKNIGAFWIIVPLKHKSSFAKISEIEIDDSTNWRYKTIKTLRINYHRAPMFDAVFPLLSHLISFETASISAFNSYAIKSICNYLQIRTIIEDDAGKYLGIENELIDLAINSPGNFDKKTSRVINICKQEKATIYHNAIGGMMLYPRKEFSRHQMQIKFISTNKISYKQFDEKFTPDLSMIDILMFNSVDTIKIMLKDYSLL
jgi:hypothetical protein